MGVFAQPDCLPYYQYISFCPPSGPPRRPHLARLYARLCLLAVSQPGWPPKYLRLLAVGPVEEFLARGHPHRRREACRSAMVS